MALLAVEDSAQRHAALCLRLNVDAEGRYLRSSAAVQVRDRRGAQLTATFVCPHVFDQQWHHLVCRVHHAQGSMRP